MDKYTIIAIIAAFAIAITLAYSGLNIYALGDLQERGTNEVGFRFFEMINDGTVEICNPSPFFVNFKKFNIIMYLDGAPKGTFATGPVFLSPYSSIVVNGTFTSDTFSEAQYYAMHFDGQFSEDVPERIDPRKLLITTEVEVPIIGVIPYTVTKQYAGLYFWETMNANIGEFGC
jgi:hypothetical protein